MEQIDREILKQVAASPGATVADACRTLLGKYTNSQIRYHLDQLQDAGLVWQDRTTVRGRVFVSLTKKGRETLA